MRKLVLLLILMIPFTVYAEISQEYVENQVIVKYKDGVRAMRSLASSSTERLIMQSNSMPEYVAENTFLLQTIDNVTDSIALLEEDPAVEYAQPNYIYYSMVVPNDSFYSANSYPYKANNGLNLESAWDIITDASSVTVGILDSGLRLTHEDLKANILNNGIDAFTNLSGVGQGVDDFGHGTHVAGIVGAVGNNSKGVTGVAWKAKLLSLRVLRRSGSTASGSTIEVVRGINYAVNNGAKVINASLGGEGSAFDIAEYEAIKRAVDSGVVFVAASGNNFQNTDATPQYPAAFGIRGLISVGASDQSSNLADFNGTATGKSCYGQTTVHLFAPGKAIQSSWINNDSSYSAQQGTSMATPFVSGSIALLLAHRPELKPWQVEMILLNSVRKTASLANQSMSGGVLDVNMMLNFNIASLYEPPKNFTINLKTGANRTVELTWDSHAGQTEIWYRDGDSGSYSYLDRLPKGLSSYTDKPNTAFTGKRYYRIRSLKSNVYSPFIRVNLAYIGYTITSKEYVTLLSASSNVYDATSISRYNEIADTSGFLDQKFKSFIVADISELKYDSQSVNSFATTKTITIKNIGENSSIIGLINSDKNNFLIDASSTCLNSKTSALPVGGSCTVDMKFVPRSIGTIQATLTITSDNNTITIPVNAVATDDKISGKLFVSLVEIDFLKKIINKYSESVVANIVNIGGSEISVNIPNSPDGFSYASSSTCIAGVNKLLAAGSCNLSIQFKPTSSKAYASDIRILANNEDNVTLKLKGVGVLSSADNLTDVKLATPISTEPIIAKKTPIPQSGGCSVAGGNKDFIFILLIISAMLYSLKIMIRSRRV